MEEKISLKEKVKEFYSKNKKLIIGGAFLFIGGYLGMKNGAYKAGNKGVADAFKNGKINIHLFSPSGKELKEHID